MGFLKEDEAKALNTGYSADTPHKGLMRQLVWYYGVEGMES
jgi:hypothetical protein